MRFGSAALGLIVLVIALAFPSWARSPEPASPPEPGPSSGSGAASALVTLGLYSGRPDPTWSMDAAELDQLIGVMEGLPEVAGAPPAVGLGYHGFFVDWPLGRVRVYPGAVVFDGDDGERYRADERRLVERLLLESGRPFLAEVEIHAVEESLRRAGNRDPAASLR